MSNSHEPLVAEISRLRAALREIGATGQNLRTFIGRQTAAENRAAVDHLISLAHAALTGGESEPAMPAEPHPLLCGARNGPSTCNRVAGHAGGFNNAGHSDGRRSW